MSFHEHTLRVETQQPIQIINISDQVQAFVKECRVQQGILHMGTAHTTVGLAVNEACEQLEQDMKDFLVRLVDPNMRYRHNAVAVDGRPNAHSHLLSLLLPSQISLLVKQGELQLGTWQSLFVIELDGPRQLRNINLTLMGMG